MMYLIQNRLENFNDSSQICNARKKYNYWKFCPHFSHVRTYLRLPTLEGIIIFLIYRCHIKVCH